MVFYAIVLRRQLAMTLTMMNTTGMEFPLCSFFHCAGVPSIKGIDLSLSCATVLFMGDYRMRT
jgi:hypothetical protein